MAKGRFIVIEGCEGAGKSKQSELLLSALKSRGVDAIATREPGGVPLGEKLRSLILDPSYSPDAVTELYLYSAARRVHLNEKVLPALEKGTTVICDRFTYSTLAYQGYGRGLDLDFVREINKRTVEPLNVDIALFLDVKPQDGFRRKGGADSGDRLERESIEFFDRVYKGFSEMADRGELVRIDASGEKEQTAAKIIKAVESIL